MAPRLRPPKASDGQAALPFIPTMPHPILVWVSTERAQPVPGGAAVRPPLPGAGRRGASVGPMRSTTACDAAVRIAMAAEVDSLNVGAAAAVLLWALRMA